MWKNGAYVIQWLQALFFISNTYRVIVFFIIHMTDLNDFFALYFTAYAFLIG